MHAFTIVGRPDTRPTTAPVTIVVHKDISGGLEGRREGGFHCLQDHLRELSVNEPPHLHSALTTPQSSGSSGVDSKRLLFHSAEGSRKHVEGRAPTPTPQPWDRDLGLRQRKEVTRSLQGSWPGCVAHCGNNGEEGSDASLMFGSSLHAKGVAEKGNVALQPRHNRFHNWANLRPPGRGCGTRHAFHNGLRSVQPHSSQREVRPVSLGNGNQPNLTSIQIYRRGVEAATGWDPAHTRVAQAGDAVNYQAEMVSYLGPRHNGLGEEKNLLPGSWGRTASPAAVLPTLTTLRKQPLGTEAGAAPSVGHPPPVERLARHPQPPTPVCPSAASSGVFLRPTRAQVAEEEQQLLLFPPMLSPLLQEVDECLEAHQLGSLLEVWRAAPQELRELLGAVGFTPREADIVLWELRRMIRVTSTTCAVAI